MERRRRLRPIQDAEYHIQAGIDKPCLQQRFINNFKGRGVFATELIFKGDFVVEYRGKLLSPQQAELQTIEYNESAKVFLFDFQWKSKTWCIDACEEDSSLGRLVNDDHRRPNCKMKTIKVNENPHLCLFAIRDITAGEELTYNYGDSNWAWRAQQVNKDVVPSVKPEIGSIKSAAAIVHADSVGTEPTTVTTADSQPADTVPKTHFTGTDTLSNMPVSDDNLQSERSKARIDKLKEHHNRCEARYESTAEKRNALQRQRTLLLLQLANLDKMLGPESHPVTQPAEDSVIPSPTDTQVWSEIDHASPSTSECVPPLERTESVFVAFQNNMDTDSSSAEDGNVSHSNPKLGPESHPVTQPAEDSVIPSPTDTQVAFQNNMDTDSSSAEDGNVSHSNPKFKKQMLGYDSEDSLSSMEITEDEYVPGSDCESEISSEGGSILKKNSATMASPAVKDGTRKTYKGPRNRNSESDTSGESSITSLTVMHSQKTDDGSRRYTKKHYCLFCEKPQSKIARHLELVHGDQSEVAKAISSPKNSKERKLQLTILRKQGDRAHNVDVIRKGKGVIVPCKQASSPNVNPNKFLHCANCQGLFKKRFLWKHMKRCPLRGVLPKPGRTRAQSICAFAQPVQEGVSKGLWKLLSDMKQGEVVDVIKSDHCILKYGEQKYNLMGHRRSDHELIRQKMRELGRLVLKGRQVSPLKSLEEYIDPANFQHTVNAVKAVTGFQCETNKIAVPTLANKLGQSLMKVADIVSCDARICGDTTKVQKAEDFKHIYQTRWREMISCHAHNTLEEKRYNAPLILPFADDVKKLHIYLKEKQQEYYSTLFNAPNTKTWAKLAKVTLAQMIIFNRKRQGEACLMPVQSFESRDKSTLNIDIADSLSEVEQALCKYFSRVEIRGKRGRKIAVLLAPEMIKSMELLVKTREVCGVLKENIYMFAIPGCETSFRGSDCLRCFAMECGAKCPKALSSTKLRKHISTMSRVLNMNDTEMDQLADFLGHDIRIHRKYYRLPEGTLQLAKITKVLMAMEQGRLNEFRGKGLDQISINPTECVEPDAGMESETELSDHSHDVTSSEPAGTSGVNSSRPVNTNEGSPEGTREVMKVTSVPRKRKWSEVEIAAVEEKMMKFIHSGVTPGKVDCIACITAAPKALGERDWQAVKYYIKNRITAYERKTTKK
uniref:SET domain-containing protein n=1 Tax=Cyprinus carpio carpio TaxID=630221 RepID=A0A9J7XR09_CYPCA